MECLYSNRMRFSDILKEAFSVTWRNRWFWFAGFLVLPQMIAGYPGDMNVAITGEFPLSQYLNALAIGVVQIVIATLAGAILHPAFAIAVLSARTGKPLRAIEALRAGSVYMGRCFLVSLFNLGGFALIFVMLGIPVLLAFLNSMFLGAVVSLFFAPVALAAGLLVSSVACYSIRNIVVRNLSAGAAIAAAFQQFKSTKSATIGLFFTALIIPMIAILPISIPVSLAKLAMVFSGGVSILTTAVFYTTVTIFSIPLVGYLGAFSSVLWTIAHREWFGDGTREPAARF